MTDPFDILCSSWQTLLIFFVLVDRPFDILCSSWQTLLIFFVLVDRPFWYSWHKIKVSINLRDSSLTYFPKKGCYILYLFFVCRAFIIVYLMMVFLANSLEKFLYKNVQMYNIFFLFHVFCKMFIFIHFWWVIKKKSYVNLKRGLNFELNLIAVKLVQEEALDDLLQSYHAAQFSYRLYLVFLRVIKRNNLRKFVIQKMFLWFMSVIYIFDRLIISKLVLYE